MPDVSLQGANRNHFPSRVRVMCFPDAPSTWSLRKKVQQTLMQREWWERPKHKPGAQASLEVTGERRMTNRQVLGRSRTLCNSPRRQSGLNPWSHCWRCRLGEPRRSNLPAQGWQS